MKQPLAWTKRPSSPSRYAKAEPSRFIRRQRQPMKAPHATANSSIASHHAIRHFPITSGADFSHSSALANTGSFSGFGTPNVNSNEPGLKV
jgi:hypothetical protein